MKIRHIKAGDEIRTLNGYITIKDCNEAGLVWVDEVIAGLDDDGNETEEIQENVRYTLNEIAHIIHDTENVWVKVWFDKEEEKEPDYWLDTDYHIGHYSEKKWALMDGDDVVMWKRYSDTGNGVEDDTDEMWKAIDQEIKEKLGFLPEYSVN